MQRCEKKMSARPPDYAEIHERRVQDQRRTIMGRLIRNLLGLTKKRRRPTDEQAKQRRRQAVRRLQKVCLRESLLVETKAEESSF
jgi:hypothetical protein